MCQIMWHSAVAKEIPIISRDWKSSWKTDVSGQEGRFFKKIIIIFNTKIFYIGV